MPPDNQVRQHNWMTGIPFVKRSPSGYSIIQRVPWFNAFIGGIAPPPMIVWALIHFHAPSNWVTGFIVFGCFTCVLLMFYVWWIWRQPPIISFNLGTGSISVPRLNLSLPKSDLERIQLLESTCSNGEGGPYPVLVLQLSPASLIYVTNRRRELRNAWTSFIEAVHTSP